MGPFTVLPRSVSRELAAIVITRLLGPDVRNFETATSGLGEA